MLRILAGNKVLEKQRLLSFIQPVSTLPNVLYAREICKNKGYKCTSSNEIHLRFINSFTPIKFCQPSPTKLQVVYASRRCRSSSSKYKQWMYSTVNKLENSIQVVSPQAKSYYDFLIRRIQLTWEDVKTWKHIRQKQKVNPNVNVSYADEMKIYSIKKDAVKVAYILPFCCVPFGFIMLVIPVYFFPRYILPHTFWTENQRKRFYLQAHQERLKAFDLILNHMNYHKLNDKNLSNSFGLKTVCNTVRAGKVPSNPMLLQLRPLFQHTSSPFALDKKKITVLLRSFCKIILVSPFQPSNWMCTRLFTHGKLILSLDLKMRRENNLYNLKSSEIELATLIRGLNSAGLSKEANIYWLKNWLELTKSCDTNDIWFVLHAMVLLSVNFNEIKYQRSVFG